MNTYTEQLKKYEIINKAILKNGAVIFGGDWICDIPVSELARDYEIDVPVYNRSIRGLSADNAEKLIDTCIFALMPNKVFINLGENDVIKDNFNADDFIDKYEWILYTIHSKCNCSIYIMSIAADKTGRINNKLKKLAEKYECEYIDIQGCVNSFLKFFSKIKFFLRNHSITLCEAMRV